MLNCIILSSTSDKIAFCKTLL